MLSSCCHRLKACLFAAFLLTQSGAARSEDIAATVLHAFDTQDGWYLSGGLIADSAGALYGVAQMGGRHDAGTVYRLTPPASGAEEWHFDVLHRFGGGWTDGFGPANELIRDSTGSLYGVTTKGGRGGAGIVFRLTPPAGGTSEWTESILYSFSDADDGGYPEGPLLLDSAGSLYGVTEHSSGRSACSLGCGSIFKLSPAGAGAGEWTETVLYRFQGDHDGAMPSGGLIFDTTGDLLGLTVSGGTAAGGTIFQLTPPKPPATAWSKEILHNFTATPDGSGPGGRLAVGPANSLYGTTEGGGGGRGTIFKLTPSSASETGWRTEVLYSFGNAGSGAGEGDPRSGVIVSGDGSLFAALAFGGLGGLGAVIRLDPPPGPGETAWHETVLQGFGARPDLGIYPTGALAVGPSGALFGTAMMQGPQGGGTVFMIAAPER